jgi:hypothetical protein
LPGRPEKLSQIRGSPRARCSCGRVTGVAADPKDANTAYIATAGGGVWKTTNATAASPTWTPLIDNLTDAGVATLTTSLPVGQHTISAAYGGSASFAASTSASLAETISPPPPTPPPPPVITTGALNFTVSRGGFFDLDQLVQPLGSDGNAVGPQLDVPFPLSLFFKVVASRDAAGNAVLTINLFFLNLHLDYGSAGQLTGLSF